MSFIKKHIEGNENKWLWFSLSLLASLLPIFTRYCASLGSNTVASFDIKDLLFAGLAMNLANFNLVSAKKIKAKLAIIGLSAILIVVISVIVGIFLMAEPQPVQNNGLPLLRLISGALVIFSIFMSYCANDYVLNTK